MTEIASPLPREPGPAPALARAEASGAAYAALDLGTNNCRLLIASPSQAGFRVLDSFSRIIRLGEGLGNSGLLSSASMDRALAALAASVRTSSLAGPCAALMPSRRKPAVKRAMVLISSPASKPKQGSSFVSFQAGKKRNSPWNPARPCSAMEIMYAQRAPLSSAMGALPPIRLRPKGKPSKSPNARFPA